MASTVIKMSQMVDLAVGAPEPGSVNFNILHSLLHVIIQQLQLEETRVEFRGIDADRMYTIVQSTPSEPVLELSEYVVYVDNDDKIIDNNEKEDKNKEKEREEKKKKLKSDSDSNARAVVVVQRKESKEVAKAAKKPAAPAKPQRTVYARTSSQSPSLDAISHKIARLEQTVTEMRDYKMPSNEELIQSVRSGNKEDGLLGGMWEKVMLAKRMDAAEAAVHKLTSMVEEVAREANIPVKTWSPKESKHSDVAKAASGMTSPGAKASAPRMASDARVVTSGEGPASAEQVRDPSGHNVAWADNREHDLEFQAKRVNSLERRMWDVENILMSGEKDGVKPLMDGEIGEAGRTSASSIGGQLSPQAAMGEEAAGVEAGGVEGEGSAGVKKPRSQHAHSLHHVGSIDIGPLREEVVKLKKELDAFMQASRPLMRMAIELPPDMMIAGFKDLEALKQKIEAMTGDSTGWKDNQEKLQSEVHQSKEAITGLDTAVTNHVETLQTQMADMEKDVGMLIERVNSGLPSEDGSNAQGFGGFGELYGKIQALQYDMDILTSTNTKLQEEKEEQKLQFNALLEQVEVLKMIKADKEDVEDALDDKADKNHMARKVSNDQFDAACDDLSKGLDEALTKLTQQENLWSLALEDIQKEIECKLDKVEISPLKDFVNAKLKMLQQRIKTLAALRNETVAAGTKRKLLKDVNCLSCDKSVVQRIDDEGNTIASEALPGTRSMRPYLTYELDAVRRQQKRMPGARNMNHFEDAMHEQKKKGGAVPAADHLCNRYCGGSHTITTPQQRVTRMGHFINQYGPQAIPITRGPPRADIKETQTSLLAVDEPAAARPPSAVEVSKRSGSALKTTSVTRAATSAKGSLEKGVASSKGVLGSRTAVASKSASLAKTDGSRSGSKMISSHPKIAEEGVGSQAKLGTPTGSPKGSPTKVGTPTGSPKGSPTGSQKGSHPGSPKPGSQTGSPKVGTPTGSPKAGSQPASGTPSQQQVGAGEAGEGVVAEEGAVVAEEPTEGAEAPVEVEAVAEGAEEVPPEVVEEVAEAPAEEAPAVEEEPVAEEPVAEPVAVVEEEEEPPAEE